MKEGSCSGANQTRRHGGIWWAYPPKQSSKTPPIRNVKHYN